MTGKVFNVSAKLKDNKWWCIFVGQNCMERSMKRINTERMWKIQVNYWPLFIVVYSIGTLELDGKLGLIEAEGREYGISM